jgi:two-component system, NarL family, nitrate/nitrite response regulator NarL
MAMSLEETARRQADDGEVRAGDRRRLDRRLLAQAGEVDTTALVPAGVPRPAGVVVVDDHALLADTMVHALRREGFLADPVAPTATDEVVAEVVRRRATVALVDLDLGSPTFDGFDLVEPLVDAGIHVVVMASTPDPLLLAASFEAGARGVVSKSAPFAVVLDAVKLAARGELAPDPVERDELGRVLRERRRDHAARLAPFHQLTPREREVLDLLIDGCSAEAIAARSYVSVATVRTQIRGVLTKLGVNSQLSAVAFATRCGWSGESATPMVRYSATLAL